MTKNVVEFSHKHIGNTTSVSIDEFRQSISLITARFNESLPHMQKMSKTKLEKAEDQLFDYKKLKLPEYIVKEAVTEFNRAGDPTSWGYYNALTFAITHKMRKEAPALSDYFGQLAWSAAFREMQNA